MYVLYLDRYHLGDPLFLKALGGALAKAGRGGPPVMLVHGSGEAAERRLEGEGYDVRRKGRVLDVRSGEERSIVEGATRELNRKIVSVLTDGMVHAVGFQGTDRGLVRLKEDGSVTLGKAEWVGALARQGAVPVLSALAKGPDGIQEADGAALVAALARAVGGEVAFVEKNRKASAEEEGGAAISAADLSESRYAEPDAVREVLGKGVGAVLVRMPELTAGGTRLVP